MWTVEIFEMFLTLSSSRAQGMGVGAIPLSEILAYFQMFGVTSDPEERGRVVTLLQRLDGAYVKAMTDKQEQERERKGKQRK